MTKITLHLMGRKGLRVLESFTETMPTIIKAVVGANDPGVNDGSYHAIKSLAEHHNLPWFDRKDANPPNSSQSMIAAGWRWMLPLPENGRLFVFHDSLLPRYRGFNPLVSMLINGEKEVGATVMVAAKDFDRGPVLYQSAVPVHYPCKIAEAIELVADVYKKLAVQLCLALASDNLPEATPQDESLATYSLWRDEEDYWINWDWDATRISRFVDAVGHPYAGARALFNHQPVVILSSEALPDVFIENRCPGKTLFLIEGQPVVVCGSGLLLVKEMKSLSSKDELRVRLRSRFQHPKDLSPGHV